MKSKEFVFIQDVPIKDLKESNYQISFIPKKVICKYSDYLCTKYDKYFFFDSRVEFNISSLPLLGGTLFLIVFIIWLFKKYFWDFFDDIYKDDINNSKNSDSSQKKVFDSISCIEELKETKFPEASISESYIKGSYVILKDLNGKTIAEIKIPE